MSYGKYRLLLPGVTPSVKYLVIANSAIFLAEFLLRLPLTSLFGMTPASFWRGWLWQPVTYMFLHGGLFHLLMNMLVLWMFGGALESAWGRRKFLIFYFICGIGAGLLNAVVTPGSTVPVVGSSGAIYGLLMAFAILYPEQLIYFWGIFPVKAKYFVAGIGVIELLTAMGTSQSGIAHFAHLGGMLFGLVYMKWDSWHKSASAWRSEKRRKGHLKVVWDRDRERQKLQQEIDRILDKAGKAGTESLTTEEHEQFRKIVSRMNELENKE